MILNFSGLPFLCYLRKVAYKKVSNCLTKVSGVDYAILAALVEQDKCNYANV